MLKLLSGIMQLGQKCNLSNYNKYKYSKDLKYLPFILTPNSIRYCPLLHKEGVKQGIESFKKVIDLFIPIINEIPKIIEKMETVIELEEELKNFEESVKDINRTFEINFNLTDYLVQLRNKLSEKQKELETLLRPLSKKFSFVYKGFKGPKDVKMF